MKLSRSLIKSTNQIRSLNYYHSLSTIEKHGQNSTVTLTCKLNCRTPLISLLVRLINYRHPDPGQLPHDLPDKSISNSSYKCLKYYHNFRQSSQYKPTKMATTKTHLLLGVVVTWLTVSCPVRACSVILLAFI